PLAMSELRRDVATGEVDDEVSVPDVPRHGGRVLKAAVGEEHAHAGRGGERLAERRGEGLALAGDEVLEVALPSSVTLGEALGVSIETHAERDAVDLAVALLGLPEHVSSPYSHAHGARGRSGS